MTCSPGDVISAKTTFKDGVPTVNNMTVYDPVYECDTDTVYTAGN